MANEKIKFFISLSFGIFLFILFFQPFPLDAFDFNNRLLFIAGLGFVVFLLLLLVRIFLYWLANLYFLRSGVFVFPAFIEGLVYTALCATAFAFYLRYVGFVHLNFFLMLKVVLVSMAPAIGIALYDTFTNLKNQNEALVFEKKLIQKQVEKYEEDYLNKSVEFYSENSTESLNLLIAEVAFINSADNYIEIAFLEANHFKKKLLRNTLKHIEQQIKPYSNFIRCHRTCIVNIHFIEKVHSHYSNHSISIKGYDKQIPVSRQYLLKLKEAI